MARHAKDAPTGGGGPRSILQWAAVLVAVVMAWELFEGVAVVLNGEGALPRRAPVQIQARRLQAILDTRHQASGSNQGRATTVGKAAEAVEADMQQGGAAGVGSSLTPTADPERIGPNLRCGRLSWLDEYPEAAVGCLVLVRAQPAASCSHTHFVYADLGDGNCACAPPAADCDSVASAAVVTAVVASLYRASRVGGGSGPHGQSVTAVGHRLVFASFPYSKGLKLALLLVHSSLRASCCFDAISIVVLTLNPDAPTIAIAAAVRSRRWRRWRTRASSACAAGNTWIRNFWDIGAGVAAQAHYPELGSKEWSTATLAHGSPCGTNGGHDHRRLRPADFDHLAREQQTAGTSRIASLVAKILAEEAPLSATRSPGPIDVAKFNGCDLVSAPGPSDPVLIKTHHPQLDVLSKLARHYTSSSNVGGIVLTMRSDATGWCKTHGLQNAEW